MRVGVPMPGITLEDFSRDSTPVCGLSSCSHTTGCIARNGRYAVADEIRPRENSVEAAHQSAREPSRYDQSAARRPILLMVLPSTLAGDRMPRSPKAKSIEIQIESFRCPHCGHFSPSPRLVYPEGRV